MIAIEMQNNSYIHALDSGLFTVGAPHNGTESFQTFSSVLSYFCLSVYSIFNSRSISESDMDTFWKSF